MTEKKVEQGDMVLLASDGDYEAYFNHLNRVFFFLNRWYLKLVEGGNTEAKIVAGFLTKLLATVRVLRFKHMYSAASPEQKLILDLDDSGFPHWMGINELEADVALQEERSKNLPSRRVMNERLLEQMLGKGKDPVALLPEMAQVQFAEELDGSKIIFDFTAGELQVVQNGFEKKEGTIRCLFSWLCYDKTVNRPFIHVMAFDYEGTEEELGTEFEQGPFLPTIRRFGDRQVALMLLATDIDEALPKVFPKIIKRVELGPIFCPRFAWQGDDETLTRWLSEFGQPDDFALKLVSSVIFSKGVYEEKHSWLFGGSAKVRQIFALKEDELTGETEASEVHRIILLPHHVLQQVNALPEFVAEFGMFGKITYTKEGEIHHVV